MLQRVIVETVQTVIGVAFVQLLLLSSFNLGCTRKYMQLFKLPCQRLKERSLEVQPKLFRGILQLSFPTWLRMSAVLFCLWLISHIFSHLFLSLICSVIELKPPAPSLSRTLPGIKLSDLLHNFTSEFIFKIKACRSLPLSEN